MALIDIEEVDLESGGDGYFRGDTLFGILAELRQAGKFCDAVIKVKNQSYPIHRNILSACSPYFKSLFTSHAFSTDKREVYIPELSVEAARQLIDFAYTRTAKISPDNVELLTCVADQFHVHGLLKLCCEYMHKNLTQTNCLGILRFAQAINCKGLEKSALRYTLKNFGKIYCTSNEFLQLSVDVLCSLLASDQLNVSCEEFVFDAVCRWVDFFPNARKVHMRRLLATVRLGLLPAMVFEGKVKGHKHVQNNTEVRPLIADTEAFLAELDVSEEPDFDMSLPFARPRVPHEILFVIGGWSGGRPIKMVETYDTRADRWVVCKSEDTMPRAYHGVIAIGCIIYVVGGFDATECFNSCRAFDTRTKLWSEVAPMNIKRSYVSVALLHGHIYAMGGFEGPPRNSSGVISSPRLRSAERFNPLTNQWTLIANMRERRSDAGATSLNDQIYICGGFNGSECLCSAEVYDPATDQWTLVPPMASRRSGVGVISYNGAIYAVGGFDGMSRTSSAERYSPVDRSWSNLSDMYNARSNFGIEVIDDMIFVIGGFNGETTIYNVECYDAQAGEWYNATDMNLYKSALSACVVRDLPDVRDYVYKKGEMPALQLPQQQQQQQQLEENTTTEVVTATPPPTTTSPPIGHESPSGVVAPTLPLNSDGTSVNYSDNAIQPVHATTSGVVVTVYSSPTAASTSLALSPSAPSSVEADT